MNEAQRQPPTQVYVRVTLFVAFVAGTVRRTILDVSVTTVWAFFSLYLNVVYISVVTSC